jgi:hypothetical protein
MQMLHARQTADYGRPMPVRSLDMSTLENLYGVTWCDTHGEVVFAHPSVVAKIAEKVVSGSTDPLWLKNHYGQIALDTSKSERVFAAVKVVQADDCGLTEEELEGLDFPVLKIAMPKGRFRLYYPLSHKENMSWEHRHWSEGSSDCYRLALDYYRTELNIHVRAVVTPENYTSQMMTYTKVNMFVENFAACDFEQVLVPEPGDAVLIKSGLATFDGPDHVGVFLGEQGFLHHFRNRLSVIQPYSSMWRQKTVMTLRHTSRM